MLVVAFLLSLLGTVFWLAGVCTTWPRSAQGSRWAW